MQIFSGKAVWLWLLLLILFTAQIPQENPDNAAGLLKTARARWAAGYFDEAYALSRQAQAQAAAEQDTLSLLSAMRQAGKYYARNGYLDEAESTLDSVILRAAWISPLHPEIFLARGERAGLEAYRGNFDHSVALHQALVRDCEALAPDDTIRPIIYQWTGQAFGYVEAYDSALFYCHKALDLFTCLFPGDKADIAYTENALGILYSETDQIEKSIRHYERASAMLSRLLRPGHSHVIQVRSNTAVQYQSLGLPWKAIDLYQINLIYLDSLKPAVKYATLFNYASALTMAGDYHESLRYLDQAEALLTAQPGLRADGLNRVYYARSAAYQSLEQYDLALRYIDLAIQKDIEVFGPAYSGLVLDYHRKGTIYEYMENLEAAAQSMQEALRVAQSSIPHSMRTGWIRESHGRIQRDMGQPRRALENFARAEAIYKHARVEWNLADTYREMAETWQLIGNADSNLIYFQKAWSIALPELPFQAAPDERAYAFWTNTQLANLFESLGASMEWRYTQSSDPAQLRAALACYEAFIAVTDSQRHYYEAGESRQVKISKQRPIVEKALARCHDLYLLDQDPAYIRRAFSLAEQSKSGNLRDHLREMQALRFAGVPDSLVERERYYRQRLVAIDAARFGEETDSATSTRLQQEHFDLNQAYRAFLRNLENQHPRYYQLKYPQSLDVEALAAQLEEAQALYSYFLGEDQVFTFRLFQGEWRVDRIDRDSSLQKALETWLGFLSQPSDASGDEALAFAAQATRLAADLLPGLAPHMQQLLIIPDGQLGYLPFGSLLGAAAPGPQFRSWPFLAQTHAITYANAAELWLQPAAPEKTPAAGYLGFAPDFGTGTPVAVRAGLGPLRYNREEVEQVARLLGGKALTGAQARESVVKELGREPLILHFATHALADESQLMQSRLYFERDSAADATEDGILHAWEVYGLNLNSPLTVLSACQTGKGPLLRGEGVMSLARAFQYGGSRSVLASRWQADDQAGARLTAAFFEALAAGAPASEALMQARRQWLEEADNYHAQPYFWAGYALIGDGGPVAVKRPVAWGFWIMGAVAMLLAGALFWRRAGSIFP